jgi:hypothetical protein
MKDRLITRIEQRFLKLRRDELLLELRMVSPVLGQQLEEILEALRKQVADSR